MRAVLGWILALALVAMPARSLTPYLVKDINPTPAPASSSPEAFAAVGKVVVFQATDPFSGRSLWRSDGTARGTYSLMPGCGDCPALRYAATPSSYFFLSNGSPSGVAIGLSLWVTGGTLETTRSLVSALRVSDDWRWVPEQGLLYFGADDGVHGDELWRSDGTVAGTFMVADLAPGAAGSSPSSLTDFGGELFFDANDGSGFALWKTDGSARGTHLVKHVNPGSQNSGDLGPIEVVGRWLVFAAFSPARGDELWRSDGTSGGTVPLRELVPGAGSPTFYGFQPLGERLLFAADTGNGANLWVTDGTNPGTRQLTHYTTSQPFDPNYGLYGMAAGGHFFFAADDGVHGQEPWTSDGTPAGTHLVSDVCPGPCSSQPFPTAVAAGRVLFDADDGVHGFELWTTDGTAGGTRMVRDICQGSCGSYPEAVAVFGSRVVLRAGDGRGEQLWSTDGTARGTVRISGFADASLFANGVEGAATGGGLLLFAGEDTAHGKQLWRSDGSRAGTYLLKDLTPDNLGGSGPNDLHAAGSRLFFFANDGIHGDSLWSSDGTAAGTALASTFGLASGEPSGGIDAATAVGETLFFSISLQGNSPDLWKSDGSPAGTLRLTPDGVSTAFSELAAIGGTVFFTANDVVHGPALWKSDGTPAGTMQVESPAFVSRDAQGLTPFQGQLFFFRDGLASGAQLWRSDGTAAGTVRVADLNQPLGDSNPPLLIEFAGRLYFFAMDGPGIGGTQRLWSTDGTTAGTRQVSSLGLVPGTPFSQQRLAVAGNRLFILGATPSASSATSTSGLWVSDGTDGGTQLLRDFGVVIQMPEMVAVGGRVAFGAPLGTDFSSPNLLWLSDGTVSGTAPMLDAGGHQIQPLPERLGSFAGLLIYETLGTGDVLLWQSDGTPAGTAPVFTVSPALFNFSNLGSELAVAGDRLYLTAFDPVNGYQLWAVKP